MLSGHGGHMSDFLSNLVARHLNMVEVVRPRLATLFEPPQVAGVSAPAPLTNIENGDLAPPADRELPAVVSAERPQSSQSAASTFLSVSSEPLPPASNPTIIEPVRAARHAQAQGSGHPAEALGESFTPSEIEARTMSTSTSQDGGSAWEIASDVGPGGSSSEGSQPATRSGVASRVVGKTEGRPIPAGAQASSVTQERGTRPNGEELAPSPTSLRKRLLRNQARSNRVMPAPRLVLASHQEWLERLSGDRFQRALKLRRSRKNGGQTERRGIGAFTKRASKRGCCEPGSIRPRHAPSPEGLSSRLVERHSGTEASAASEVTQSAPVTFGQVAPVPKGLIAAASPVVVQPRSVPTFKAGEIEPAQPLEATQAASAVQITIGRIEIRATPPLVPPGKQRPASRVMSLDDYLNKRDRGAHGR